MSSVLGSFSPQWGHSCKREGGMIEPNWAKSVEFKINEVHGHRCQVVMTPYVLQAAIANCGTAWFDCRSLLPEGLGFKDDCFVNLVFNEVECTYNAIVFSLHCCSGLIIGGSGMTY